MQRRVYILLIFLINCSDGNSQSTVKLIRDIHYGENICYRTSYPYSADTDQSSLISKLLSECYTNSPQWNELELDIYVPNQTSSYLIILLHDGAFQVGDKSDILMEELANHLSSNGMVVASINYSLGFQASEAQLFGAIHKSVQDTRGAIRYILKNYASLFNDNLKIVIGGASAGGISALTTANMEEGEYDEYYRDKTGGTFYFDCLDCKTNSIKIDWELSGVFSLWGGIFNSSILNSQIPTLLIHGNMDEVVPIDKGIPFQKLELSNEYGKFILTNGIIGSRTLKNQFLQHATYVELKGKPHSPHYDSNGQIDSGSMNLIKNEVLKFLKTI